MIQVLNNPFLATLITPFWGNLLVILHLLAVLGFLMFFFLYSLIFGAYCLYWMGTPDYHKMGFTTIGVLGIILSIVFALWLGGWHWVMSVMGVSASILALIVGIQS